MRLLFLVWAALWRIPTRTVLTLLSLAVAFLLFGLLQGVNSAFEAAGGRARADRLLVDPRFSNPLKKDYGEKIARVPGVLAVSGSISFNGFYQDPKNRLGITVADGNMFTVHDELTVDPHQRDTLFRTRTGMLITEAFAQKAGVHVGDSIPITSRVPRTDGQPWTFQIVGIVHLPEKAGPIPFGIANYEYFNESQSMVKDKVARFDVRIADPRRSVDIARAIDAQFASSDAPSRTQAENEFAQSDMARIGDVRTLTRIVIAAVFFSILFLVANVMRQAARERTPEFGMLKTLGFSDLQVLVVVAAEALLLCLLGAAAGLGLAVVVFPHVASYLPGLSGFLGTSELSYSVLLLGFVAAVALTVASAALPAWRAMRITIVDALRTRA